MHINSIAAYREEFDKLSQRSKAIYFYLLNAGVARTDRMILGAIFGEGDMNMVRPRITELLQDGWLVETGSVKDVTGKTVRLVKALTQAEILDGKRDELQTEMAL